MKRIIMASVAILSAALVFAYNPPVGSQNLFNLSSPTILTSATSSAGGGIFMPGAESISLNPALTALEQRTQLDVGFTALISTNSEESGGAAVQTGILIPTKAFVSSGILNGVFCSADCMDIANTFNMRAGIAKEITDRLSLGLSLNGGIFWGADSDWALGADFGLLYRLGNLGFMKDFRIGFAEMNLGKYYSNTLPGLNDSSSTDDFPGILTTRLGVAALLFSTEQFKGGFSFDMSIPTFKDVIFDFGLQFSFKDLVYLSIAEKIDVVEASQGHADLIPAIGLSFKVNLNAKNNDYLKSHSWDSSEMLAGLAWQQKYEEIQAVSGGASISLGKKDVNPPVIQLGVDDKE